ncbi:MAG: secreted protein containing a domain [Paenibacillus sp.]|nr:secreted protein containing a domain [Paenibacillus sp.]
MEEKGAVARRMLASAGTTALAMWLLLYAPTPYVVYEPGIVVPVRQLVKLQNAGGDGSLPPDAAESGQTDNEGMTGSFVLTAVRLTGPNLWGVIKAGVDRDKDVRLKREVFGGQSKKQYVDRIHAVMSSSQETALQAAYEFASVPYHIVEGKIVPEHKKNAVTIQADEIGGPSAGLVFALQTIDLLTEGDLTHDLRIAATGTIDSQGGIGAIGGVKQKTVSVSQGGADLFLVPKGNEEQAKKTAKRLRSDTVIIGVGTIAEAVQAIDSYAAKGRQG